MVVGILRIEVYIPGNRSLKGKRMVLKSLKDRLKHRFNISIAEVDYHDNWQRALLGIAMIGPDRRYVNGALDQVLNRLREMRPLEIVQADLELL